MSPRPRDYIRIGPISTMYVYETENDLSLYIPLVDLNEENGGRLSVLPESKMKLSGNVVLRLLRDHFSAHADYLGEDGYVDPDRIDAKGIAAFAKSKSHQDLMAMYKGAAALAKAQYINDPVRVDESRGRVLMFNNKNFHAAEQWRRTDFDREIYVIRMFPLYDAGIQLKRHLHGALINHTLLDTRDGTVTRLNDRVDLASLPKEDLLAV